MKQKSGGGRKGGGGPILINKENRPGGKESILETAAGDAYYNNPNVSFRLFWYEDDKDEFYKNVN